MSDPFSAYGLDVGLGVIGNPLKEKPKPLQGTIKTRSAARIAYAGIVSELHACEDQDMLDCYLMTVGEPLLQFQTELDYFWLGNGDEFIGLAAEIENAKQRVSGDEPGSAAAWAE